MIAIVGLIILLALHLCYRALPKLGADTTIFVDLRSVSWLWVAALISLLIDRDSWTLKLTRIFLLIMFLISLRDVRYNWVDGYAGEEYISFDLDSFKYKENEYCIEYSSVFIIFKNGRNSHKFLRGFWPIAYPENSFNPIAYKCTENVVS